jgi:hypothetical protein
MLTLFHFPGAICAQKVRVALAEEGLAGLPPMGRKRRSGRRLLPPGS